MPDATRALRWKRLAGGYLSDDGEWFLSRGARMTHGANAWLVHRRVGHERIGSEDSSLYFDTANGDPLWALDADGYLETQRPPYEGPLYAHEFDCGWLSEAKAVVANTLDR